jgi:catechol 2,3-dioxygenase-like lactoylglutathione lyase family enzyme
MPRLHHVNVTCPAADLDRVTAFYRDVLELTPVPKAPGTDPRGAWFAIDGVRQLHVSVRDASPHPDAHFALIVEDLTAVITRLRRFGSEWQPAAPVFGGGRGFTRDPGGNRIELLDRTGSLA